ncbi:MAG: hypothetical protein RL012_136 [Bacteroidota bacterium]|jgi:hypothetical protein
MALTHKVSVTAAEFLVLLEFQHNKLATKQQLSSFVGISNNHEKNHHRTTMLFSFC